MEKKNISISKRRGPFYGWVVVGAAFLLMAAAMGITYNCNSVFIKPVCADMGYTRPQAAMIQTIMSVGMVAVSLFAGKLFKKFSLLSLMRVSSVVVGAAYFCYSFAQNLALYYALAVVVSVSSTLLTLLPLSIILNNWFCERKGLAIGLAFMGSGVGGMLFNSLAGLWIEQLGWRATYQILGVIMLVLLVPCTFFVIKVHPRDMGLSPLGAETETEQVEQPEEPALGAPFRRPAFWGVCIAACVMAVGGNTMVQIIAPHYSDAGYTATFAANLSAAAMGALAVGKLIVGQMFDRLGPKKTTVICSAASVVGLGSLFLPHFAPAMGGLMLGVGLGSAFGSVGIPILTHFAFGQRRYQASYAIVNAFNSVGGVIAPILTNAIFDVSGGYGLSFWVCIAFAVFSAAVYTRVLSARPQGE